MKPVRGSKTTDLNTTGREREGKERELAITSERVKDREKWRNAEDFLLRQILRTSHQVQSSKKMSTQVQSVRVRVVVMIIELSMELRPPEKEQRGLLEMTTTGTRVAVKDILLLMNGDILLPVSEGEEGRGGEAIMREEVDHLPLQRDRKGVEPRIVSVSEAVEGRELVIEKERHLVNMMMVIIKGAGEVEGEEDSSNLQLHRKRICLRAEAFPLAVAGGPLCYPIHQDPLHC